MKGRDKFFKCLICGKYIAYKDIPNKVSYEYHRDGYGQILPEYDPCGIYHKECES